MNRTMLTAAAAAIIGSVSVAEAGLIVDRATLDTLLGGNQIFEDFESFDVAVGGATNLDVFSLDENTIANGQGPGLVMGGATYVDPAQTQLQWNGDTYVGLQSKTLLSNGGTGTIEIQYSAPVTAMGVDLRAFSGYGYNGVVDVYDTGNSLIGTFNFGLASGGAENVFFGWEDGGGIGRVVVSSGDFSWSPIIDNHGYGRALPAPGALAAFGLFGLLGSRRRR